MNIRTRIATIATASLFALSLGTAALAEDTVTQEIGINSGALSASIGSATLEPVQFSNTARMNDGQLTLNVKDERGSNAGWNVTISSGDFDSTTQGVNASIPASGFRYVQTQVGDVVSVIGSTTNLHPNSQTQPLDSQFRILYAQSQAGTGDYNLPFDVELDIPAQQPVGTYTAELTINITSGPGN